jgi:hypothetical protein
VWCAKKNDHFQWLKVDLRRLTTVTRIDIQGRYNSNQFVRQFWLYYSVDGYHWAIYRWKNADTMFQANHDRYTVKSNALNPPIYARYVRINPRGWTSRICMKIELFGCAANRCEAPLGIQDYRVRKSMFSASSLLNHYYGPWSTRLQDRNHGYYRGGWYPKYNRRGEWVQVDLGTQARVTKVAIQGRYDANQYVKTFTMSYGNNGLRFYQYKVHGAVRTFVGNVERYFVNVNRLVPSIKARYIRIYPQTWYSHIEMRMELYGCRLSQQCNKPLGMQTGRINTHMITASSYWDKNLAPWQARLHGGRSWSARMNNYNQWLRVDFRRPAR